MTFDTSLDSTYNPDFVTANGGSVDAAEAALAASLAAGTAYLNIHSTVFPGGEIRGFLRVVPVPDASPTMVCLVHGPDRLGNVPSKVRGAAECIKECGLQQAKGGKVRPEWFRSPLSQLSRAHAGVTLSRFVRLYP